MCSTPCRQVAGCSEFLIAAASHLGPVRVHYVPNDRGACPGGRSAISQVTRSQVAALLAEGVRLLAEYQDRLADQDTFGVRIAGRPWCQAQPVFQADRHPQRSQDSRSGGKEEPH